MCRLTIEQMTASINAQVAQVSPQYELIAHDALKIIYCCLSKLKLRETEIEKAVNEMEFVIELGSGKIMKSLTAASLSGKKTDPCDLPDSGRSQRLG